MRMRWLVLGLIGIALASSIARAEDPVVRVEVFAPTDIETLENLTYVVHVTIGSGNNTIAYSGPVEAQILQHDVQVHGATLEARNGTAAGSWEIPCERFVDDVLVIATVNATVNGTAIVVQAQRPVAVHKSDECAQQIADQDEASRRRRDEERWGGILGLVTILLLVILFLAAVVLLAAQTKYATEEHLPIWHDKLRSRIGFGEDPLARALPPIAELSKQKALRLDEVRALTNRLRRIAAKQKELDARLVLGDRLVLGIGKYMPKPWLRRLKRSYAIKKKFAHANALEVQRLEDQRRDARETAQAFAKEVDELRAMHDLPPEGTFVADVSKLVRPAPGGGNGG